MTREWDDALNAVLPLETLRLLITLIREYYEQHGQWPSATALRGLLRRPGA